MQNVLHPNLRKISLQLATLVIASTFLLMSIGTPVVQGKQTSIPAITNEANRPPVSLQDSLSIDSNWNKVSIAWELTKLGFKMEAHVTVDSFDGFNEQMEARMQRGEVTQFQLELWESIKLMMLQIPGYHTNDLNHNYRIFLKEMTVGSLIDELAIIIVEEMTGRVSYKQVYSVLKAMYLKMPTARLQLELDKEILKQTTGDE